jgi:hypothetical protein
VTGDFRAAGQNFAENSPNGIRIVYTRYAQLFPAAL